VRDPWSSIPRPLPPLLLAVLLLAFTWALLVPPWEAPDETAHFAYAQLVAERFDLPGETGDGLSSELTLAWLSSNAPQVAAILATKPEWSRDAYARWKAADARLAASAREDGQGFNPASTNPPLYYLYAAPAYLAASAGDIFDRLYLMRLWSALLLLVTCVGTWLLAGELFGRDRPLQVCSTAVVGLHPMMTFISSSVSPDGLLFALWSLALWLGVRVLKRGLTLVDGVALFTTVGLAVLVKGTSYALVPPAFLALAVGTWRRRGEGARRIAPLAAAAVLAFAIPAGGWLITARALDRPAVNQIGASGAENASLDVRSFGSYLWQFYFPRLPWQTPFSAIGDLRVKSVWVDTGWAAFGWLEVRFPSWVYKLLAFASALVLAGAVLIVLLQWRSIDHAVVAFLGLALLCLLAGLHWVEYKTVVEQQLPFNQGRYLFPLLPLWGVAVAGLVQRVPERAKPAALGMVVGALFVLQLFSLGLVAERYFA
jgi:4-amino-4-deoxy-L-arabinose transferase-like glycosyltransferase